MSWFVIIILAYFLFAFTSLIDKLILAGPPNPKTYVFYVGILGILVLVLIPFVGFSVPNIYLILLCFLAGVINIFGLYALFEGLERFEATRIISAVGGMTPIFAFGLIYFFSGMAEMLKPLEFFSFLLLILGSVVITMEKGKKHSFYSLGISVLAAFFFSLFFLLSKYVYLSLPFWTGFIWIRIGAFLTVLLFIATKASRKQIFSKKVRFDKKTGTLFLINQVIGSAGFILQSFAVALAGFVYIPIINALQGIQYTFLFILTTFISFKFPKILKEKITLKIISQKVLAIVFIGAGLIILSFYT